jgi:Fe-S-cluster containining protein
MTTASNRSKLGFKPLPVFESKGGEMKRMDFRECGECQECCTRMGVYSTYPDGTPFEKPFEQRCKHLCDSGCGIYAGRPKACRVFFCLWKMMYFKTPMMPEEMRPDKLGIVITGDDVDDVLILKAYESRKGALKSKLFKQWCERANRQGAAIIPLELDGSQKGDTDYRTILLPTDPKLRHKLVRIIEQGKVAQL